MAEWPTTSRCAWADKMTRDKKKKKKKKETAKRTGIAITESGLAAEFLPASRRAPLPRIFGNPKCHDTKISSAYSSLPGICPGIEKDCRTVRIQRMFSLGLAEPPHHSSSGVR